MRLYDLPGAWCAGVNSKQQYLQIDFRGTRKVTEIASQGRPRSNDYVSSYTLSFSLNGGRFQFHRLVRFTSDKGKPSPVSLFHRVENLRTSGIYRLAEVGEYTILPKFQKKKFRKRQVRATFVAFAKGDARKCSLS